MAEKCAPCGDQAAELETYALRIGRLWENAYGCFPCDVVPSVPTAAVDEHRGTGSPGMWAASMSVSKETGNTDRTSDVPHLSAVKETAKISK